MTPVLHRWFTEYNETSMSKRNWRASVAEALRDRFWVQSDLVVPFYLVDEQPKEEIPQDAEAVQESGSTPVESGASSSHAAEKKATVSYTDRIYEESMCRAMLAELDWIGLFHWDDECYDDAKALYEQAKDFISNFTWDHSKRFPLSCLNARMVTVECMWTLDYLQSQGWMPRNVTNPHDRKIREAAGQACSPFHTDPGNWIWDIMFHVLRLDKYVVQRRVEPVMRTAPAEYGAGSNKSSKGPVNLRGNILEAILFDLQTMSSEPEGQERKKRWIAKSDSLGSQSAGAQK